MRRRWLLAGFLTLMACGDATDDDAEAVATTTTVAPTPTTTTTTTTTSTTAPPTTTTTTTSTTAPPTTTTTTTSTTAPPTTTTTVPPVPPRVLLVGDSTLLAVESYGVEDGLTGFDPVLEVASCRTLGVPSCGSEPLPPNSLDVIETSTGPFAGVVIMAGYDEWWTTFDTSFAAVVEASRAKDAGWILWLDYPEDVPYLLPDGRSANESFIRINTALATFAASGDWPDLVVADWDTYSDRAPEWITDDGIHLHPVGAYGVADYISRWVAHLEGLPCPVPVSPGGDVGTPCPSPDDLAETPDIAGLYLDS